MLPKPYRLPYSIRLSGGFSIKHPLFIAKVADSEGINPRFGVVISKKIDKRSVKRNRMRRLLHTFIYNNLDSFPQKKSYLFIVTSLFDELPDNLLQSLQTDFSKILI